MCDVYFNVICLGIIGTKEYRKPEWVTHMEELQAALKGKPNESSPCMWLERSSDGISSDSLEVPRTKSAQGNKHPSVTSVPDHLSKSHDEMDESVFVKLDSVLRRSSASMGLSSISVRSEPTPKSIPRGGFIKSAMDEYLNSHRHSLSSVMELWDCAERQQLMSEPTSPSFEHDVEPTHYEAHVSYYTLSPIEENSETSTSSREAAVKHRNVYYSSLNQLTAKVDDTDYTEKCQTFPRSKHGSNLGKHYYESAMYPLEPRELDPNAYNQLHTADSQEELQEFLLLESECVQEKGRGLAAAFTPSDEEIDESCWKRGGKLTQLISQRVLCFVLFFD